MKLQHKATDAVITVYLSLILLLILSLVFTIIEGARVSTARVFAERALSTSTDSVLAEFYGPLWEEYHIFGYAAGEGSPEEKAQNIEGLLSEYMSYTFTPEKGLEPGKKSWLDLYDITPQSITAGHQTKLMDYQGELLVNEAVEYMKYNQTADALELLLNKLSLLETPKKVSAVYEDKLAAEEKLARIDKNVLKLMKLLDGIHTSKRGIVPDKNGRLQIENYFVKKLCLGSNTRETASINHEKVFEAVRDSYVNPLYDIITTKNKLIHLEELTKQLSNMDYLFSANAERLHQVQNQMAVITSDGKIKKSEKAQYKKCINQLDEISAAGEELLAEKEQLKAQQRLIEGEANASLQKLYTLIKELRPITEEAASVTDQIISGAASAEDVIKEFENSLSKEGEGLGEELLTDLTQSLEQMKRYTDASRGNQTYVSMKALLIDNLSILNQCEALLLQGKLQLQAGYYSNSRDSLDTVLKKLEGYHREEFALDYSTLVFEKEKRKDPVEAVGNAIKSGLTSLVIDPAHISEKELTEEQLPSLEAAMSEKETDFGSMLSEFMENCAVGNEDGIKGFFGGFSDAGKLMDTLGEGINLAANRLVYQEYLREHFDTYPTCEEDGKGRKPSALIYEQEYLLAGKLSDQENLSSTVTRIIFLRMIMDFVSILGDKVKCEEALAAATALVGFTGMPILISITKTTLLLVWAFAEALVDTCALILGKQVPILKKQVVLTFPEIFMLNRSFLQSKVSRLEESKLSFSYEDYIRLFLLLKARKVLAYRSMDLMQENIRLRYEEETFCFSDCLYGFQTKAEFSVKTKFIGIPFVIRSLNHNITGFRFSSQIENCY